MQNSNFFKFFKFFKCFKFFKLSNILVKIFITKGFNDVTKFYDPTAY